MSKQISLYKKKIKQLTLNSIDKYSFIYEMKILQNLIHLLNKKYILVSESFVFALGTKIYVSLKLFFQSNKLTKYKKKIYKINDLIKDNFLRELNYKNELLKNNIINKLFKRSFIFDKGSFFSSNVIFTVSNLNLNLKKVDVLFVKKYLDKNRVYSFFNDSFSKYLDFIKVTSLFINGKFTIKSYLYVLGKIFKSILKKKHKIFMKFLKNIGSLFMEYKHITNSRGIKFIVLGRIRGKTRSSVVNIVDGAVSLSRVKNFTKKEKIDVYTRYGAFGFKMFVNYI